MFKNFDWVIFTTFMCVAIIVVGFVGVFVYAIKYEDQQSKKRNQCTTACHPYAVMSSEDKYCLCANTSTVIWRKDIK